MRKSSLEIVAAGDPCVLTNGSLPFCTNCGLAVEWDKNEDAWYHAESGNISCGDGHNVAESPEDPDYEGPRGPDETAHFRAC